MMNIAKGLIGRKLMMHQLFTEKGEVIPVTYIEVPENTVTQIKKIATDGYDASQIALSHFSNKKIKKPQQKHFAKSNLKGIIYCTEIRNMKDQNLGDKLNLSLFKVGEFVDVRAISKGKGTAGVIKRHHFSRGPMTHGSKHHRAPGSIGISRPDKVWKGQPLPGRKGANWTKIQNLEIIQIIPEANLLVLKGSVPGANKTFLIIQNSIKQKKARSSRSLIQYQDLNQLTSSLQKSVSDFSKSKTHETLHSQKEGVSPPLETPSFLNAKTKSISKKTIKSSDNKRENSKILKEKKSTQTES